MAYKRLKKPTWAVTGYIGPDARLVHTGNRRGIKYEIYANPGDPYETRFTTVRSPNYAAVVYYPYTENDGTQKTEPEEIGSGKTIADAISKADRYIERIWHSATFPSPIRRVFIARENPLHRVVQLTRRQEQLIQDVFSARAHDDRNRLHVATVELLSTNNRDELAEIKRRLNATDQYQRMRAFGENPLGAPAWMLIGALGAVGVLSYVFFSKPALAALPSTPSGGGAKTVTVGPQSANIALNVGDTLLVQLNATMPATFLPTWIGTALTPGTFTQSGNDITEPFKAAAPGTMIVTYTPATIDASGTPIPNGGVPIVYNVTVS